MSDADRQNADKLVKETLDQLIAQAGFFRVKLATEYARNERTLEDFSNQLNRLHKLLLGAEAEAFYQSHGV